MATFNDLISKIDMSESNKVRIDFERLACSEFGVQIPYIPESKLSGINERFKGYWLSCRMSTDTEVGIILYFFDNKFVAYSTQEARKSDVMYSWKSKKCADDVKSWIESLA
ncbi:hypothetical protein [Photobacterium damselae]|uniref:hypothetical protein n=1 Tax=Photobacterium damselae TaxID=38293 RepID=UPI001F39D3EC|nr:hypothetical protein [Photobacterium damselae]UKA04914.1 hypothetical protein IHC89_21970 [Photobacterium damselae subsp. damselae]